MVVVRAPIFLIMQDPTQFMNSQNGTYESEIDQYEEAGGFILDRNLPLITKTYGEFYANPIFTHNGPREGP